MKKHEVRGGIREWLVSRSSGLSSGFQNVSQDNRLGKGQGSCQVREGPSDHRPLCLVPDVYCARWERVSVKPGAIK